MDRHRIRALREQYGESQQRFAARLGVALSTLQKWEGGQNRPRNLLILNRLARVERNAPEPASVAVDVEA
ncbi:MAG: hypothetical protein A2Z99_08385 [Treponema sp. GWB1_62_6]|nr:MAG: hypothetical protein A2Z99_08385 [Treponema sp. GWB1_62_6]